MSGQAELLTVLKESDALTEEQLYEALGRLDYYQELYSPDNIILHVYFLKFPSLEEFIERGKKFFNKIKDWLYQKICIEFDWCSKSKTVGDVKSVLATFLGSQELPAEAKGWVAIGMIIAILLKMGLDRFCECDKKSVKNQQTIEAKA